MKLKKQSQVNKFSSVDTSKKNSSTPGSTCPLRRDFWHNFLAASLLLFRWHLLHYCCCIRHYGLLGSPKSKENHWGNYVLLLDSLPESRPHDDILSNADSPWCANSCSYQARWISRKRSVGNEFALTDSHDKISTRRYWNWLVTVRLVFNCCSHWRWINVRGYC